MPLLPSAANPNIIANFNKWIIPWTDNVKILAGGPYTYKFEQYSCTINKDSSVESTRSYFKKKGCKGIGSERRRMGRPRSSFEVLHSPGKIMSRWRTCGCPSPMSIRARAGTLTPRTTA
jgi:hypothetical protein